MKYSSLKIALCTLVLLLTSTAFATSSLTPFDPQKAPKAPDYTQESGWLSVPANPDQHAVDVFWVYPTILFDDTHWLMPPTDSKLKQAAQRSITRQASVFTGQANLYAPLYRQMNMAGLTLSAADRDALMQYGAEDVHKAFTYYLKHRNNGRPFIIAGHSQGSNILVDYLVEKWGSLGVEQQLVAAYLIGWSITNKNLKDNPAMEMCGDAIQTGCFIAYNTMAAGRQDAAPTLTKDSVAVNPLTWNTSGEKAPASLNIGAVFFDENGAGKPIPHFTSAQIVDFGLVVDPADPALVDMGESTFPKGVYHVFDYSLFYENLKANVAQRIKAHTAK